MIASLALFWGGMPKWAQDILKIIGVALIIIVTGKTIAEMLKAEGANREKQKQAIETAKERERVIETSNREISNVQDAKDAALAAPDLLPEYPSADVLREQAPAIGRVILGDRRADKPGS